MSKNKSHIVTWLVVSALMICIMILVGGLTRLFDAGLSIVEWKPIVGIIPPLSDYDWNIEFSKYINSPEFQKLHSYFTLDDFKKIFWLEYLHRILGRITGAIIILPGIYFWSVSKLHSKKNFVLITTLVLFQGLMGWLMVKSGLIDDPYVSHFRLASHLILAIILYSIILWDIFNLIISSNSSFRYVVDKTSANILYLGINLLFAQIFFGGLVAGLDAGMIYNTFPLMGDKFIPNEVILSMDILYNPASVQFLHRIIGYLIAVLILIFAYRIRKFHMWNGLMLVVAVFIQIILGIITLIYIVPVTIALIHQLFAVLLLSLMLYTVNMTMMKNGEVK